MCISFMWCVLPEESTGPYASNILTELLPGPSSLVKRLAPVQTVYYTDCTSSYQIKFRSRGPRTLTVYMYILHVAETLTNVLVRFQLELFIG